MKAHAVGKHLSAVERAYLAGFIDGDGAIMATIERHAEKRFGFRVRLEIKITQYHRHDIAWLIPATGVGYIRQNNRTYEWVVRNRHAVAWLIDVIAPYIRTKTKQVKIARRMVRRTMLTKRDLVTMAQLADTLSSFNVRSKDRRKNYASMIKVSAPLTTDS